MRGRMLSLISRRLEQATDAARLALRGAVVQRGFLLGRGVLGGSVPSTGAACLLTGRAWSPQVGLARGAWQSTRESVPDRDRQ
jgi:hypothetical protein